MLHPQSDDGVRLLASRRDEPVICAKLAAAKIRPDPCLAALRRGLPNATYGGLAFNTRFRLLNDGLMSTIGHVDDLCGVRTAAPLR